MARKKYINTNDFVSGLMTFVPDIELAPINKENKIINGNRLAAAGNDLSNGTVKKIGYLTDPSKTITARVMENKETESYNLYFIPEDDVQVKYSIISNPSTGKYFLINEDEKADIPFKMNINPISDDLVISFPKEIFEYHHRRMDEEYLKGNHGFGLKVTFKENQDCLICELFDERDEDREFTKLLIFSIIKGERFFRLVPVIHNRAIVPLTDEFRGVFVISIYL